MLVVENFIKGLIWLVFWLISLVFKGINYIYEKLNLDKLLNYHLIFTYVPIIHAITLLIALVVNGTADIRKGLGLEYALPFIIITTLFLISSIIILIVFRQKKLTNKNIILMLISGFLAFLTSLPQHHSRTMKPKNMIFFILSYLIYTLITFENEVTVLQDNSFIKRINHFTKILKVEASESSTLADRKYNPHLFNRVVFGLFLFSLLAIVDDSLLTRGVEGYLMFIQYPAIMLIFATIYAHALALMNRAKYLHVVLNVFSSSQFMMVLSLIKTTSIIDIFDTHYVNDVSYRATSQTRLSQTYSQITVEPYVYSRLKVSNEVYKVIFALVLILMGIGFKLGFALISPLLLVFFYGISLFTL